MSHSSVEIVRVVWRRLLVVSHCFCKRKREREREREREKEEGEGEGRGRETEGERKGEKVGEREGGREKKISCTCNSKKVLSNVKALFQGIVHSLQYYAVG